MSGELQEGKQHDAASFLGEILTRLADEQQSLCKSITLQLKSIKICLICDKVTVHNISLD